MIGYEERWVRVGSGRVFMVWFLVLVVVGFGFIREERKKE